MTDLANVTPEVAYATWVSRKMQLKLESKGMTSSGGALRPRLAKACGLKPRDPHTTYIAVCQANMDQILARKVLSETLAQGLIPTWLSDARLQEIEEGSAFTEVEIVTLLDPFQAP